MKLLLLVTFVAPIVILAVVAFPNHRNGTSDSDSDDGGAEQQLFNSTLPDGEGGPFDPWRNNNSGPIQPRPFSWDDERYKLKIKDGDYKLKVKIRTG
uniref:Putative secreted protein n=1 Tax=Psorophora albipes TaxID=869069 RepID=T1DFS0_9DIPT